MAATYYTLLTNIGQAKIANAIALGQTVAWTAMAVGDGNGNPTTPVQTQTALVRETYRALINQLTVDPENPNYMVAELIIPTNVGGWSVNEVGIFDEAGDMIAVANFPATYKPELAEGSGRDLVVRIIIQVSNASIVTLKIDPAIVLASQKWVVDNYVKKITVAGGTTGQVLAKLSNANEAFQWVDPTAAVSVLVDAIPERQTLAAAQVVVNLAVITTAGLAVYIEGARLIETIDYVANSGTRITLARSYPAGSRIHMYQNDPTSLIADATETARGFIQLATTAEAQALTSDAHALTPKKMADALTATATKFTPAGGIASTNVQAAIEELDSEKLAKTGGAISGDLTVAGSTQTGVVKTTAYADPGFNNNNIGSSLNGVNGAYFCREPDNYSIYVNATALNGGNVANYVSFLMYGNTNVGAIRANGLSTVYATTSDYRMKEQIEPITGGLEKVKQLKPCSWRWKGSDLRSQGFIAHELQGVVPECVSGEKDAQELIGDVTDADGVDVLISVTEPTELPAGQTWTQTGTRPIYQGVDASFLIGTLVAAIQEQQAQIEALTNRVDAMSQP